ncbi:MAG: dihydrodipicolinate synthase family protein [Calditrichia bacterium]
MYDLSGIFPPIATPFENDEIALSRLSFNLKKLKEFNLSGYVVLGSNGENLLLSETEALQIVETAVENIPADRRIIVGAGMESTRGTIAFIKKIAGLGAQIALVITPHYYKSQMKPASIESFYRQVADASPVPILIYNVPKFTGLEVPPETVARLASHENIIGMKDSSGNLTYQSSVFSLLNGEFQLLTGTANTLMPSLIMGAAGGILALANIAPGICVDIFRLVRENKLQQARELQLKVLRLNQLTTGVYGIGGLKFAMETAGFYGGDPRLPLQQPDEKGRREIVAELEKLNLVKK